MAKDKERAVNPAAAQRKADKQKALKKGKAAIAAQRNERLAHRNPDRLQRQVDELKELESSSGGKLSARDKKNLEDLERDLIRVRKAKETLGDKKRPEKTPSEKRSTRDGPQATGYRASGTGTGTSNSNGSILGKRAREDRRHEEHSETDEEVRKIPMPRDTPPPIPRQPPRVRGAGSSANAIPLGQGRGGGERGVYALPDRPSEVPVPAVQTVYEAKAMVRDLRKEAVRKFVPTVVQRKLQARKGAGGKLLEEEELENLERQGYGERRAVSPAKQNDEANSAAGGKDLEAAGVSVSRGSEKDDHDRRLLQEEEERFEQELRSVQIEEVDDEDL